MNETVKNWLKGLYLREIGETKETIKNEHLWELGYDGDELNPHTENIEMMSEYIDVLKEKLEELND